MKSAPLNLLKCKVHVKQQNFEKTKKQKQKTKNKKEIKKQTNNKTKKPYSLVNEATTS